MEDNTLIEKPTFGPFFWIFLISVFLLISVFFVRQMFFLPINTKTVADMILDSSKQKADPLKKYFPTPYSIKDLQRGDL